MSEFCKNNMIISTEKVEGLDENERKRVAFHAVYRLREIVGKRAVHRALELYLALDGYDVHKL